MQVHPLALTAESDRQSSKQLSSTSSGDISQSKSQLDHVATEVTTQANPPNDNETLRKMLQAPQNSQGSTRLLMFSMALLSNLSSHPGALSSLSVVRACFFLAWLMFC